MLPIRSQLPVDLQDTPALEVLVAVFTVRPDRTGRVCLQVLLWQRAREPAAGRWALPGGLVLTAEDVDASASRQLAQKVDLARVAHLEQIGVFSDPERVPGSRVVATGFLGLVPLDADPTAARGHRLAPGRRPAADTALDHGVIVERALPAAAGQALLHQHRLRAGAGRIHHRRAAQGLRDRARARRRPTNLQRILTRRGMLEPTGTTAPPGRPAAGRPRCTGSRRELRVTDPFAAFRPPA